VTGSMLIELAGSYVQALNLGSVPTIESAWDCMQTSELERAFREAIALYESSLRETSKFPMIDAQEKQMLTFLKS
jgi:hypothetical protein